MCSSLAVSCPGGRPHRARIGHTAPEAAVAGWRICPLASRDAAVARADSEDRSAYVPDHAYCGAPAHACPADYPVCRRPARQGAGQAKLVKMQRPAGRTILTSLAWSAGLAPWSMADGMIRLHLQPATHGADATIIPEPEGPRRRPARHWTRDPGGRMLGLPQ
jgi:hypothetical protein